jgi:imidazolonepropionase-like amidohydrolase
MLIHNATLWDGTGSAPRRGTAMRAHEDRLTWVGPDARAPRPAAGEPVIDAAGRWVLPGLIDLHVHLTADPQQPEMLRYILTTPIPEQTLLGALHARLMLEAGFTAARDVGGAGYGNVGLKRAIDAGWIPGPRLATAGWFLTVPGGHADMVLRPDVDVPAPHVISGPGEARRAVREQVKRGADWIKLLATGGVMTGGSALGTSLWEDDELRAAVGMARRLGRPVAAHCHGAAGIVAAAEAGVATVEHGTMGDGAAAEAMARHGVVLVPTFCAAAGVVRQAKAGALPPAIAAQALAIEPAHAGAFRAAVEAGVKIACGTDTGVPGTAFGENAQELAHLVVHGLTPEQALLAATRDAAAVLGWGDRLGTLQPDRLADFLLLDGDPLADVSCLADRARLQLVVKGGQVAADRRPERTANHNPTSAPGRMPSPSTWASPSPKAAG